MPQKVNTMSQVLAQLDSRQQRALHKNSRIVMNALKDLLNVDTLRLTETDQVRVLRWLSWKRHLNVSLSTVLHHVFTWGRGVAGAKIKFRRRANLFPLAIATMTGEAAYSYVQEKVATGESESSTESLRATMMSDAIGELPEVHVKKALSYESPDDYGDSYVTQMNARRKAIEQAEISLSRTKPFRGNPFR